MKFIPGEKEVVGENGEKVMESTYSGHIECYNTRFDHKFNVPVWDVRDGEIARRQVNKLLSSSARGSKYFTNTAENMSSKEDRKNGWR